MMLSGYLIIFMIRGFSISPPLATWAGKPNPKFGQEMPRTVVPIIRSYALQRLPMNAVAEFGRPPKAPWKAP